MNFLATWMARHTWYAMLWLMRRPWMRNAQRSMLKHLVREKRRDAARVGIVRQNAFARRHGLRVLTFMFTLLIASVIFTTCYFFALGIFESHGMNQGS